MSYSKESTEIVEFELHAPANSPLAIKLDDAHVSGNAVEFDVASDGIANAGSFYVQERVRIEGRWTTYRLRRVP